MDMIAVPPSSPPPPLPSEEKIVPHPAFLGALHGIWLFTWKSQLTWRRLPLSLACLLVLPVLVYFTMVSPESWVEHPSWAPSPPTQVDAFARRLARSKLQLQPEQRRELLNIFTEEYQRESLASGDAVAADTAGEQIKACYDRIQKRAQTVLDGPQFAQFKQFSKRKMDDSLKQVTRLGEKPWGRTGPFYHWLIDFYFLVILPLNSARTCGGLIRDELQENTLGFLTTRPLGRAKLLIGKYLSQTALWQIIALVETLLLFGAGSLRQVPAVWSLLPIVLAAQFLALQAWSALGALLGLITKRYMAAGIIYGLIVELGIGQIPTNIHTLSLMRHLEALLARNPALQTIYEWPDQSVLISVGALALATIVFLGLAAFLFSVREYQHAAEMQR